MAWIRIWHRTHPRAPAVRLLWDVRAVDAVVEFLESTEAGHRTATRVLGPREEEGEASGGEEEEGGPAPPQAALSFVFPFVYFYLFFLSFVLSFVRWAGEQEIGVP